MSPTRITVSGAPEGFDARLILDEADRSGGVVMHVARDDKRMAAMREALAFFAPDLPVVTFPGWDCLPYDRVSPNPDISAARMATLAGLVHGMPKRFVLLTTLSAATQRVPAREVLREAAFTARSGSRIDEAGLRAFLVRMGFMQAPTVTEPGDYAIRGGIIDIYPPGESGPVRLDPVKEITSMSSEATIACPTSMPFSLTEFTTPGGSDGAPAMHFMIRAWMSGVWAAGLMTVVQPAASAGARDRIRSVTGAFHGTMIPATPAASRWKSDMLPGAVSCIVPRMLRASPA